MQITTSDSGNTGLVCMSAGEARDVVAKIKEHIGAARELLLDLYNRDGWVALGYGSWQECVREEFGKSRSYLYRQLAAGKLEKALSLPVGVHPESHMRPLVEILDGDDQRQRAYAIATSNGSVTAEGFKRAAWETWVMSEMPESVIAARLEAGEIGARQAYEIARMATEDEDGIIQLCSDPNLALALLEIRDKGGKLWDEVKATLCLPSLDGQIPLCDATMSNLQSFMVIDSAERRARHVEENRAHYSRVEAITRDIIARAEKVGGMIINEDTEELKANAWELLCAIEELKKAKEKQKDERANGSDS